MIHPYDPQAAMNAKYEALARKDADTARRFGPSAWRDDWMPPKETPMDTLPTIPVGTPVRYWTGLREGDGKVSRTRSTVQLLGGHTPVVWVHDESSCIGLTHVEVISDRELAAARASQAATGPHSPGGDAGAAHDPDGVSAGHTEARMYPDDVPDEWVALGRDALIRVGEFLRDYQRTLSVALAAVIPAIREQAVRAERERLAAMLIEHGNREPQTSGFRRGLRAAAQHVAAQNISAEDVARALGNALRSTRGVQ